MSESFEVTDLAALTDWSFGSTGGGTVDLDTASAAQSGTTTLRFDTTTNFTNVTSEAIVDLDLSSVAGETDLTFDFWMKRLNSSTHSGFFMQVDVSGDGILWQPLSPSLQPVGNVWIHYVYDLDARLADAGITLDGDVFIRLQQASYFTSHEAIIDDFRVGQFGDLLGPAIESILPSGTTPGPLNSLDVTFNEAIDPTSFTVDDIVITAADGTTVALSSDPVDSGDHTTFTLPLTESQTLRGSYMVRIGPDITDVAGNPMNQDRDEVNGETQGDDELFETVVIGPATAQTLPYFEDFEVADLQSLNGMSLYAEAGSSIALQTSFPHSGEKVLQINGGGSPAGFESVEVLLDLQGQSTATDLSLDFWGQRAGYNTSNLRLSASDNGQSFVELTSLVVPSGSYQNFFFDLDALLDTANITRDSDVYLRLDHSGYAGSALRIDDLRVANRNADGPFVASLAPASPVAAPLGQVEITFSEPIDTSSFAADDVTILDVGGNEILLSGDPVDSGDQMTFLLNFASPQAVASNYRITIDPGIIDLDGNPLNQDRDQINAEFIEDRFQGEVTIGPATSQSVPYFQDFEVSDLASLPGWTFAAGVGGAIDIYELDEPFSPTQHLRFHQGSSVATVVLDLSSQSLSTDLALDFRAKRLGASSSLNTLTVSASGDGVVWTQLGQPINSDWNTYANYFYDLDQELANASIALDQDVYIRFSHNAYNSQYRLVIDDVRVTNRDAVGPAIVAMTPSGVTAAPVSQIQVVFSEPIDGSTFSAEDITVLGPLGELSVSSDPIDSGDGKTFDLSLDQPSTQAGVYYVMVGPEVLDLAGNPMNQDSDGSNGGVNDVYEGTFQIDSIPSLEFPYFQGFTDASELNGHWFFHSSPGGRIQLVDDGGRQVLRMDGLGVDSVNEAILSIDLAGKSGVRVAFNQNHVGDSTTAGDHIAISNNRGTTWHTINMLFADRAWDSFDIDLDAAVTAAGMSYTDDFWIRLQQYGRYAWPSNGREFDDFRVTTETTPPSIIAGSPSQLIRPPATIDHFDLTFSEPIDPTSFTLADLTLKYEAVDISDQINSITGDGVDYTVHFNSQGLGQYELTVGPEILDLAANPLDQNAAGGTGQIPEDQFVATVDFNIPRSLGYREDFTSELPDEAWSFRSYGNGEISVVDGQLKLDAFATLENGVLIEGRNRAILHLDLAGETRFKLNFDAVDNDLYTNTTSPAIGTVGDGFNWGDVVAVSDNGGTTWTILDLLNTAGYRSYDVGNFAAANGLALVDNFMVMIQQHDSKYAGGHWLIDNVAVERETLSLSAVNTTAVEGTTDGYFVTITREADADLASELLVWLASSDSSEIAVPSTVTIPAGAMSVDVPVSIEDDTEIDGPQIASVSVGADGVAARSIDFIVGDDEPETLRASIDRTTINENDGPAAATGTIWRNRGLDTDLVVSLASSDPTAFTVPETIAIPIGETSATFPIASHNDYLVDGTQTADVIATAPSFTGASASLEVENDDTPTDRTIGGYFTGQLPKDQYTVTFDVEVPVDGTWTIDAGAELLFDTSTTLTVSGTLIAQGQPGDEIKFTSSAVNPAPADWTGIRFIAESQDRSLLDFTEISYGVNGVNFDYVNAPSLEIRNSDIHNHSDSGVSLRARRGDFISDVLIQDSKLHDNGYSGVYILAQGSTGSSNASAFATVVGNEMYNNANSGMRVAGTYSAFIGEARRGTARAEASKNHLHHNGTGLVLYTSESSGAPLGATVAGSYANNLINDNSGPGVEILRYGPSTVSTDLFNNTIVNNQGSGIVHSLDGVGSMLIKNNLVVGNESGIRGFDTSSPIDPAEIFIPVAGQTGFNNVFGNTGGDWINYPPEFGTARTTNVNGTPSDAEFNISIDPMFLANTLFVVDDASPVNDAGIFNGAPRDDYLGRLRSAPIDIGMYEHDFATNIVTTLADEDDGRLGLGSGDSLREVMNAAIARLGADTITFDPTLTGTITLGGTTLPEITDDLMIMGPGATTLAISGGDQSRIFDIASGAEVAISGLTIRNAVNSAIYSLGDLTIRNSFFTDNVGEDGAAVSSFQPLVIEDSEFLSNRAVWGGAIFSRNDLTIDRSTIAFNVATSGGGGVYARSRPIVVRDSVFADNRADGENGSYPLRGGGAIGSENGLTLERSTITANSTPFSGGGIYVRSQLSILDSTIDHNIAGRSGGGIHIGTPNSIIANTTLSANEAGEDGGAITVGIGNRANLVNSTVTGNRADSNGDGFGDGGGIYLWASPNNSIIAGNFRGTGSVPSDLTHTTTPGGFNNLIGDAASSGGLVNGVDGNIVGADPMLAPLADNGGSTKTHALLNGSPAIDGGDNALAVDEVAIALPFDQRGDGYLRILDGDRSGAAIVDIGAFETTPPPIVDKITINGGNSQRSLLDRLTISFDQAVEFDESAGSPFELVNLNTGQRVDVVSGISTLGTTTTIELTFLPGPSVGPGGGLLDGNYRLTLKADRIMTGAMALDGAGDGSVSDYVFGADAADNFFRLFADSDGDRDVDGQDYGRFGLSFLKPNGDPGFNPIFDSDADGDVDGKDYGRFGLNFLKKI